MNYQLSMMFSIWKSFLAMIFPKICVACESDLIEGEEQICSKCRYHLPYLALHEEKENVLKAKFYGKVPLEYALAYLKFQKTSRVQKMMHSLKYEGNQRVGEILGEWYGAKLKENGYENTFDLILPVPLHPSKLKKRGYNQSDCIAKGLSLGLNVAWQDDLLIRTKATKTQTRKSRLERYQNVDKIFEIQNAKKVKDKHILVIDDVVTTGSTLVSCLETIQEYAPKSLSIATIAMA